MTTPYKPFAATTYSLGSSLSSTATTILLSSFLEPVTATPYTMALLDTQIAYATIAPKTTSSEFISFTGITQNANGSALLTGVVRGLAKKSPFTTDVAYKLPHSGGSQFIISDAPQVFNEYATLGNAETITGVKTFTVSPVVPTGGTGTQAANATDIANAVIGTSGTATNLVAGTTKLSVAAASAPSPIAVGDNDPRLPTQGENDALVGSLGTPSSSNPFITQQNLRTVTAMAAQAIDGTLGSIFTRTLAASETFTQSGFTTGRVFMVEVKQGAGTTYTTTWFAGITWITGGAVAPIQTVVTNGITTYGFRCTGANTFLGYLVSSQ